MTNSSKQLIKGVVVLAMILFLLIPAILVTSIVRERKDRKVDVINAVAKNWATAQTVSAPYIVMPTNNVKLNQDKEQFYLQAADNTIDTKIDMKNVNRTIFVIPTYNSVQKMEGSFTPADYDKLLATATQINLDKASLCINITDVKGIAESPTITVNNKSYPLISTVINNGNQQVLSIALALLAWDKLTPLNYTINLKLRGTESLQYLPTAAFNKISISSNCKDPSFTGNFITEDKTITDTNFVANWTISNIQTSVATVATALPNIENIKFGVTLTNGVDSYVKTERTSKYAILFIALTFALFYLIELVKGTALHPIQYMLIGVALIVFYTLLLSISEILGFNFAYLIASAATITLITMYAKQAMQSIKNALAVGGVLTILYGYIFWILQLEDVALLMGSIGLFIIIAIAMKFSNKINHQATPTALPNNN